MICRQCDKTCSVMDFANKHYGHSVPPDFYENPNLSSVFDGSLEINSLIMLMSAYLGDDASFEPGDTVLILDEIQFCPNARA